MKRVIFTVFIALFTILAGKSQSTLTPDQILSKAVSAITNSKGVECNFTVSGSAYSGSGRIRTLGSKFTVSLPDVEVWYNGKDLYTLNKRVGETTVINPTPEELSETNPLAYISGAQKNYTVDFSTVKKTGKYVLELLPKTKKGMIKRITLTLNKTTFAPEKIVMEPKSGSPLTSEINSFKTGVASPVTEFDYPKSKYPKVEINDLR